ncbi:MAG: hypothetical protein ABEI31_10595 [Halodesulfurarchaeum sp.]
METNTAQLAEYLTEEVGDALRAVGYHTAETHDLVYIRDDVAAAYPPERIEDFLDVSRSINEDLSRLDEMGRPKASLHTMGEGYILQFHRDEGRIIYVAMDHDVGRNFNAFVESCLEVLD